MGHIYWPIPRCIIVNLALYFIISIFPAYIYIYLYNFLTCVCAKELAIYSADIIVSRRNFMFLISANKRFHSFHSYILSMNHARLLYLYSMFAML